MKTEETIKFISDDDDDEYIFAFDDDVLTFPDEYDPGNEIECNFGGITSNMIIDWF